MHSWSHSNWQKFSSRLYDLVESSFQPHCLVPTSLDQICSKIAQDCTIQSYIVDVPISGEFQQTGTAYIQYVVQHNSEVSQWISKYLKNYITQALRCKTPVPAPFLPSKKRTCACQASARFHHGLYNK